tara:strand:+ start:339 stop:1952 length:1614 start_codon:yes stop_codon:yes gene_type:complete
LEINRFYKLEYKRWAIGNLILGLIILLPLFTLLYNFIFFDGSSFKHIFENLIFDYTINTFYLTLITCFFSLIFGTFPAWIISNYNLKGRLFYDLLLFLPLSIPSYIMAFTYSDILSFTGPVQSFFRNNIPQISNFFNRDYLQIEFLGILLSLALFPYVYTASRISFSYLGSNYINLSKNLGLSSFKTFFKVILPLSKPAILSGLFLVIMEVLNEYGAVKYFGVNTYTTGIFRSWFSMGDPDSAIQLACILLFFVLLLFVIESKSNSKKKFHFKVNSRIQKLNSVGKGRNFIFHLICFLPSFFGFIIPFCYILINSFSIIKKINFLELLKLIFNSVGISVISSFFIVVISIIFLFTEKLTKSKLNSFISQLISLGYAIPGAVISLGLIILFSDIQNNFFSITIIGSFFLLVYAYIVRFLAVSISPIKSNLIKQPDSLNDTAKNLGLGPIKIFQKIHLPISKLALISAFTITFVDLLKELPITLILRPFNFDTLATQTYQFAIEEMLIESSVYSLFIISIGCIMLLILKRNLNKDLDVS